MSSRRDLKKRINSQMEELYTECIFYKVYTIGADQAAADRIIMHISELQSELLKKVNVNEGKGVKGRVKAYYKRLNENIKEQTSVISKEITTLG